MLHQRTATWVGPSWKAVYLGVSMHQFLLLIDSEHGGCSLRRPGSKEEYLPSNQYQLQLDHEARTSVVQHRSLDLRASDILTQNNRLHCRSESPQLLHERSVLRSSQRRYSDAVYFDEREEILEKVQPLNPYQNYQTVAWSGVRAPSFRGYSLAVVQRVYS